MLNFENMKMKELVDYYNSYEGNKPIKKFRDKSTAITRCKNLLQAVIKVEDAGYPAVKKDLSDQALRNRNMSSSLRLDRTILTMCPYVEEEGDGGFLKEPELSEFNNVHQMWQVNPEWLTGAQVDRLTRTLYSNAKQGKKVEVVINNRTFILKNVR